MSINDLNTTPSQDPEVVSPSNEDTATDLNLPDELTVLKTRAKMMGIVFSNNIGLDALKKKIEDHQAGESKQPEAVVAAPVTPTANPLAPASEVAAAPAATKRPKTLRQHLMDEQMKLVRIRIQNLDDKKKDLKGEIFTVANEYLGTVKKFIPYDETSENGYHVPYCIYQMLKDKQFLSIRTGKDKKGNPQVRTSMVREFSIEVLPPLTEEELYKLGQAQLAAGSVDSN